MAQVTSPIILDSTGQQIHSDLQQIKNVLTSPSAAADITFDNTGTGMQADDVQDAITELKSNLTQLNGLNVVKSITTPASVISFSDGSNLPMYKLLLSIEPVQEGSGDPSPENIRPISGHTEANVVVSPTEDAEDGTTYTIQFKDGSNPLTVYGGTLDVLRGLFTVTHSKVDLGNGNWEQNSYVTSAYNLIVSGIKKGKLNEKSNILCEAFATAITVTATALPNLSVMVANGAPIIVARDDNYISNPTDFKTAMNGVQLVYELATPQTYQLTPTQVKSLLGTNNVWADTGDILKVDYLAILNFS